MKLRRMRSFFLLLLILAIPILAFAEAGEMAVQEIAVSNTPMRRFFYTFEVADVPI